MLGSFKDELPRSAIKMHSDNVIKRSTSQIKSGAADNNTNTSKLGKKAPNPELVKIPDMSLDCLDALDQLLKKDPKERITIFDFLHHPWLQNYQKWKNRKIWGASYSDGSSSSVALSDDSEDEAKQVD